MIVKKYIKGGLNSDSNPSILQDGDYLNALNIRTLIGDDGKAGVIRPVPGHTKVLTIADDRAGQIATEFTQDVKHICVDEVNGYAYAFVSGIYENQFGPILQDPIKAYPRIVRINLYDYSTDIILNSRDIRSQYTNNWEPSFDSTYEWDDLVEAKVVGDTLIWINELGYQFSINTKAVLNDDPNKPIFRFNIRERRDVSLIKAPPVFQLSCLKLNDTNYTGKNFIKDGVFQFAYRYVYAGYEQSVVSPWSEEVSINIETDEFNCIKITVPIDEKPPVSVLHIDIICKNNLTGGINLIKRFSTTDTYSLNLINDHYFETSQLTYTFYNDNVYESIDTAYFIKQFDAVPIKSYSIEVAKDRLFLANNTEGYDTPKSVTISVNTTSNLPEEGSVNLEYGLQTFNEVKVYERTESPRSDQTYLDLKYTYLYWRNILYIDGIANPGYYYACAEIDPGSGNATVTDPDITLGNRNATYTNVCEINTNPGTVDLTDLNLFNGCEIYVTGFSNAVNNGFYFVEEVLSSSAMRVVKSDTANGVVEEVPTGAISITLISSLYSQSSGDVSLVPPPISCSFDELPYIGSNINDIPTKNYFIERDMLEYEDTNYVTYGGMVFDDNVDTVSITGISSSQIRTFKSDSRYNIGVQFYDFALRKCGVVYRAKNQEGELVDISLSVPDTSYSTSGGQTLISWGLTTDVEDIPLWAKYYSIVRTDNLSTRYFIQGRTKVIVTGSELSYVDKEADTGSYDVANTPTNLSYDESVVGVCLDLETILNDGFGYIYEEENGDIVKLYKDSGESYILKVIGQQGRYIILEPKDLGPISSGDTWLYEIRRPYKPITSEPFYEGKLYLINDWGTVDRDYSVKYGVLSGDTFILNEREYMNLRTEYRNTWLRNLGRSCFVDLVGQVYKPTGIRWSNTFVAGSQINGLSTFDALDYKDAPVELGPINKLKNTSKSQSDGNVMLAIGQNNTASMYLSETSLIDNSGQSLLTTSGAVIGTINILRGRFGTTIPSSVVEYDGNVYWADILNECVVRYSGNGLFAISDYGMRNFFRTYFKTKKDYVNPYDITQSPYMYGGYNPATDEYILSFDPCDNIYPDNYPDNSEVRLSDPKMMYKWYEPNPYGGEGFDTTGKSIGFSLSQERWTSFYSHVGPYFNFGGKMYSFVTSIYPFPYSPGGDYLSGGIFIFDKDSTINSFRGSVRDSFISVPINDAPSNIKVYQAISMEGTTAPTTTYVETFSPNNQVTNMVSSDYINREDVLYSEILRDRISPNVDGTADEKMYTGDKMRGQYANVSAVWENPTNFEIRFINVNIKDSIGHTKLSQ
jgi:hypothetical protein